MAYTSLGWHRAHDYAYSLASPLVPETVRLQEAIGRTLAHDVVVERAVPHFDSSVMDGWAVRGKPPWSVIDLETMPEETDSQAILRRMRWMRSVTLDDGQAVRVRAGALVPEETDGILVHGRGQLRPGSTGGRRILERNSLARDDEPDAGEHVRKTGEEAQPGETVLASPAKLTPAHIAWLASCGLDVVSVLRRPRVTLIFTGAGLVDYGEPEKGLVRDVFDPQLAAYAEMLGGEVIGSHHAGADFESLLKLLGTDAHDESRIREATGDVVITTGGTGAMATHGIRAALTATGAELLVDGVTVQPGHPLLLARLADGRLLVALPGHPLAAMTGMLTLVAPLLAGLAGAEKPGSGRVLLGEDIEPGIRTRLLPYKLVDGAAVASPWRFAGMLRGLAEADGVLVCPREGGAAGESMKDLTLPW